MWVFDERGNNPESQYGRLRVEPDSSYQPCHTNLHFKWLRSPRKMLSTIVSDGNVLQANNYSVCVYYGEDDIVHRIISEEFDYSEVLLSVHPIKLSRSMDTNEFFELESHWLSFSPWKEIIEERNQRLAEMKRKREEVERQRLNTFLNRRPVRGRPRL